MLPLLRELANGNYSIDIVWRLSGVHARQQRYRSDYNHGTNDSSEVA